MGITTLPIQVGSVGDPDTLVSVECIVDSGATYSVIPRDVLAGLGIRPLGRESFRLADGSVIEREKGGALFRFDERVGVADVIFGEPGDMALLGALTLEALGLSLDPLRRELKPIPLLM